MSTEQTLKEMLEYGKRVAFKISQDPEAESEANLASWLAIEAFDETKGVPLKRWVARWVKFAVWNMNKKKRPELKQELWWEFVATYDDQPEPEFAQEDWDLICKNRVDGIPLDVIARRSGTTVYAVRKRLAAIESRLLNAMERDVRSKKPVPRENNKLERLTTEEDCGDC